MGTIEYLLLRLQRDSAFGGKSERRAYRRAGMFRKDDAPISWSKPAVPACSIVCGGPLGLCNHPRHQRWFPGFPAKDVDIEMAATGNG